MEKIKVLVLGLGNFGHSWAMQVVPSCEDMAELAGVVDADEEKHADFRGRVPCFTDLEEALETVRPDLVINVTAPHQHFNTTMQILEKGIAVLCEKPIASNLKEARALADYAEQKKAFLMIAENYRYAPVFRECRRLIETESLGRLHMAECHFRHYHPDSRHTYHGKLEHPLLEDVSIHHLDLARYLTGEEPLRVKTQEWEAPYTWYQSKPANASVFTEMTNGVRFHYFGTLGSPVSETDWSGDWSLEFDRGILQIQNDRLYVITGEGRRELYVPGKRDEDSRVIMLKEAIGALRQNRMGETQIADNIKTFSWLAAAIHAGSTEEEPLIRNFLDCSLREERIHGGEGLCRHSTVFSEEDFAAPIRFLNYTVIPKGCSFGAHKHGRDNEIYILLEGEGSYESNGVRRKVKAGDIMVNSPFAVHSIRNEGQTQMRLIVLEVYF